jgi:hypothetical protein
VWASIRRSSTRAQCGIFSARSPGDTILPADGDPPRRRGHGLGARSTSSSADDDGVLDAGDWIDGLSGEPGFFVVRPRSSRSARGHRDDLQRRTFLGQDLDYPTNIASLGKLPLVVVSHGNGHLYTWYDHIGYHLASYGCIVMSHQNQTQPGIETASTTTLTNTDYLLGHLSTLAGGALQGHVDRHRIVWIGHSRGGEGVVRAYSRIHEGSYVPANFEVSDIVLVRSRRPCLPPVELGSARRTTTCGSGGGRRRRRLRGPPECQSFNLLDRRPARGGRSRSMASAITFHDGPTDLVANGPCLLTRAQTRAHEELLPSRS